VIDNQILIDFTVKNLVTFFEKCSVYCETNPNPELVKKFRMHQDP
jgi:hypothetical protein